MPLDHDVIAAVNDEIMRIQAKEYRHERHHFKLDDEAPGESPSETWNAAVASTDAGRQQNSWRG